MYSYHAIRSRLIKFNYSFFFFYRMLFFTRRTRCNGIDRDNHYFSSFIELSSRRGHRAGCCRCLFSLILYKCIIDKLKKALKKYKIIILRWDHFRLLYTLIINVLLYNVVNIVSYRFCSRTIRIGHGGTWRGPAYVCIRYLVLSGTIISNLSTINTPNTVVRPDEVRIALGKRKNRHGLSYPSTHTTIQDITLLDDFFCAPDPVLIQNRRSF